MGRLGSHVPLRALPSDDDVLIVALEEPVKEHAYLQVLTKESQEWRFHFSENPEQAPAVTENKGFEVYVCIVCMFFFDACVQ